MPDIDAVKIKGLKREQWVRCTHCERCYQVGEYRVVHDKMAARFFGNGDLQMCPYSDCDGDTVMDAMPWSSFRGKRDDLPEIPERNVVYSM